MGFPWQFGELIFNGETLAARNASIEAQVGRWLLDPLQRGRDLGNIQPPLGVRENQVCRLRVDRSHDMTPNGLWYSARSILLFVCGNYGVPRCLVIVSCLSGFLLAMSKFQATRTMLILNPFDRWMVLRR